MKAPSNIFKESITQVDEVVRLQDLEQVRKLIPKSTQFVTIASGVQIANPKRLSFTFSWGNPFTGVRTHTNTKGRKLLGYLMHDGNSLTFTNSDQTVFQVPLAEIGNVATNSKGFTVTLPEQTYLFGQILGVHKDATMKFRTFDTAADNTGGWYKELVKVGVISKQQAKKHKINQIISLLLWVAVLVVLIVIIY